MGSSSCPYQRRQFLKGVAGAAAAWGLGACGGGSSPSSPSPPASPTGSGTLGPRVKAPNPFVASNGRPILVDVEGEDFDLMLQEGLKTLGGLQRLVPGQADVLINPNFNMPEEYPWISRPGSVAALVREVRAVTGGRVVVADEGYEPGPAAYSHLNLYPTVAAEGGEVETFSHTYRVRRQQWEQARPDFSVYSLAYDAPVIVSLCNVKRHRLAGFSTALKNNVGIVAGAGATETRGYLHFDSGDLIGVVAEIAGLVNPELFVVDAQSILTRRGPSMADGGVPVVANRLILCGDMVATDAYCTRLLAAFDDSYEPSSADGLLSRAAQIGLGQPDLAQVDIHEVTA